MRNIKSFLVMFLMFVVVILTAPFMYLILWIDGYYKKES